MEDIRESRFRHGRSTRRGRVWMGLFILLVGTLALLRSFGVSLPDWIFTWQAFLIGLGLFIGLKHGFRRGGWWVPIIVGLAFLANDYYYEGALYRHLWPAMLILLGIIFILKPSSRKSCKRWQKECGPAMLAAVEEEKYGQDDFIDFTSIFSGSKKNILTKNFKGGDLVNIFGGTDLNLSQADINGKALLEVTAIFGGSTLTIPSNWVVQSDAVTIFGGIQDKRPLAGIQEDPEKVLVLKGTVIFGGIEIKSF